MTDRELMQMALDALDAKQEMLNKFAAILGADPRNNKSAASEALRARLAQPEPQAIMWLKVDEDGDVAGFHWAFPLPQGEYSVYPVPYQPQREWQGLTLGDLMGILNKDADETDLDIARAIEAKLKEKNNG